ncbi:MAG: nicotinate-nucleotide--dimethylbenzimidazole phosphoribosyltransferase [Clostridiales bacterium]|jgi:nicotinate-nucleotide--dimethylbenzimidazole phosphoribosyltransferase|nr:nicotinate-nucleotide--dimethylbenzimidazole phosphoribosyltransferase [Clostridiales bacterium]
MKHTEKELSELLKVIKPLNEDTMEKAKERQNYLAKPPGSLGYLEDISIKLAGITGEVKNSVKKQAVVIMSADNGVCEEGVASAPQQVTLAQTINFTRRITGVSAMAKYFDFDLLVIDMGVAMDIPKELYTNNMTVEEDGKLRITRGIVDRSLGKGTKNLFKEPAMTRNQVMEAIFTGIDSVKAMKDCGIEMFGVGEMGIGNTTTSASVLAAITDLPAIDIVGRGGGLNDKGLAKKIEVVEKSTRNLSKDDPIDVLSKVGGFDIAAMVGAFMGAAIYRIPVVIDGFISANAALVAKIICPKVTDFMFASHKSYEIGYMKTMKELDLKPMFNLDMRLGEGSGCPIAFKIIETATGTMNLMWTLEEASIDAEYLEEIRDKNLF